ncbi:MAG: hypothetical protein KGI54_12765 [Pseudomonadota bacterium]|nr:hypothetical protein [Pseudomonadota bacterium]
MNKRVTDLGKSAHEELDHAVSRLVGIIHGYPFSLSTEKNLQAEVEQVLTHEGIRFDREKYLSPQDIPDFFIEGGLVMECKMHGARKKNVYRQLCRYARYEEVNALILVSNLSMGLPPDLHTKPLYFASLSRGWM